MLQTDAGPILTTTDQELSDSETIPEMPDPKDPKGESKDLFCLCSSCDEDVKNIVNMVYCEEKTLSEGILD